MMLRHYRVDEPTHLELKLGPKDESVYANFITRDTSMSVGAALLRFLFICL